MCFDDFFIRGVGVLVNFLLDGWVFDEFFIRGVGVLMIFIRGLGV